MVALVGYTGFVGSNIYSAAGGEIHSVYNTKNISDAYGTKPDLLIYAGVRAEKYLANHEPQKDLKSIEEAENNIKMIDPKRLVLISTIDVFKFPNQVDERSEIDIDGLHAYGMNRYKLEVWARKHFPDALILRLPGLFGKGIRKNFIYDFIHVVPSKLKESKFIELLDKDRTLNFYYEENDNGFYSVKDLSIDDRKDLKQKFKEIGFTALNFTDSRSRYQFYNLSRLWSDIKVALINDIKLLHTATEPISAGDLYEYLTGEKFFNWLDTVPADYDYRTCYGEVFDTNKSHYIESKDDLKKQIKKFIYEESVK